MGYAISGQAQDQHLEREIDRGLTVLKTVDMAKWAGFFLLYLGVGLSLFWTFVMASGAGRFLASSGVLVMAAAATAAAIAGVGNLVIRSEKRRLAELLQALERTKRLTPEAIREIRSQVNRVAVAGPAH